MKLWPRDAAWIYLEKDNAPSLSIAIYVFDTESDAFGAMSSEEVQEFLAERLPVVAEFTRKLQRVPFDLDHPSWVEDSDFDLGRHLTVLDAGGGGWRELQRIVSEFVGRRIDLSRPPWEMRVVTGLRDIDGVAEASVVLAKFHHSLGDGAVTLEIARRLFAPRPDIVEDAVSPGTPLSRTRLVLRAVRTIPGQLRAFAGGLRTASRAGRDIRDAVRDGRIQLPPKVRAATRFNGTVAPVRAFDAASFLLEDFRVVAAAVGNATVNDVALTIVSGALHHYLRETGEEYPGSLGANVPMSLRSQGNLKASNQFTTLQVELHGEIGDPVQRLRAIHDSVKQEQARKRFEAVQRAESLVDVTPGFVVRILNRLSTALPTSASTVPYANVVVTNVDRSASDLWLRGARVVSTYGAAALSERQGLTHAVHTLGARLTISVLTDPGMMTDLERYIACLHQQFEALATAVDVSLTDCGR